MLGSEPSQQCENFFGLIVIQSKWQPTPVFLPGKSHGWRNLVGYSPWGCKESDTTEQHLLYFYFSLCVTHLSDMGFDFIIIVLLRPSAMASSLSLDIGYLFFGGFQCPLVDHCSTASYCFDALTRGDECMSFCSTILNQKPLEFWFLHFGIYFFFCIWFEVSFFPKGYQDNPSYILKRESILHWIS